MTCDRIAYPYLDTATGTHKYDGMRGGLVECATVIVSANRIGIDITVSVADDLGRQDGTAEFCRSYGTTCPVGLVVFTAPSFSSGGTAFHHWTKDGIQQTQFEGIVELDPCDNVCHTLRAVYGSVIIDPPGCYTNVVIPDAALVTISAVYTPLPCTAAPPFNSGCPNNISPFIPAACYTTLWNAWNFGEFEVDFRRFDFDPQFFIHYSTHTGYPDPSGFESIQVCSPAVINIVPGDCEPNDLLPDQCWCECNVGGNCVSPIIECTIPPFCQGGCGAIQQHGFKFWTRWWNCIFRISCFCGPTDIKILWEVSTQKNFCVRGNEGDCCFVCTPPGNPFCGCPCSIGGPLTNGLTLTVNTFDFSSQPPQEVTGTRLPGESCSDAIQRLFDGVVESGLHFERDDIVSTLPITETCTMRRQQTIDVTF